jgi:hypothetical protein
MNPIDTTDSMGDPARRDAHRATEAHALPRQPQGEQPLRPAPHDFIVLNAHFIPQPEPISNPHTP